ncbi:uncharacterized protein N7511_003563 [Penicillium nucicola]|uniref:uncharacterized protein n=1 Tax=Penicillium nucicola TaxID=1850975 RepID=UPI0025459A33|nr:uncharacterized protein N7511_003563 [Penicillium nucicola]KAJ5771512.1 hypothetical protein N7511_003563 [Penicillium nucicola]
MSFDNSIRPSVMEMMGYTNLEALAPPHETVTEVVTSLRSRPNVVSGPTTYGRGDRKACNSFLKFGIQDGDLQFTRKVEEAIGRHPFPLHQGPVIVQSSNLPSNWNIHAAHPCQKGVSMFRSVSGNLERGVTTLKLYPLSHNVSSTEFAQERGTPRSFDLKSTDVLFVRGAIKMETSVPAGGFFVWQGFSENPWGKDPAACEAPAFMKI